MTIGIYCIENLINGKKYIGKSVNIERRFASHKALMKSNVFKPKQINRHLWNAAQKYGLENFTFTVVEEFGKVDETLIAERELHWIDHYQTTCRDNGYNLRRDSSTGMITHDETREKYRNRTGTKNPNFGNKWSDDQKKSMREIAIKRHHSDNSPYNDEWRSKIGKASSRIWKDEKLKKQMAEKVRKAKSKYVFFQYDKKTGKIVKVWGSIGHITDNHPDYHVQAIYSVCNGWKKSYRGFKWSKQLKIWSTF